MPLDPRQSVLSAALFTRAVASDLCEVLAEEDFTDIQRPLYIAIRNTLSADGVVDPSSVATALGKAGHVDPYRSILPYLDDEDSRTRNLLFDPDGRRIVLEHIRGQRLRRDIVKMVAERRYDEIPPYLAAFGRTKDSSEGVITVEKIGLFMALIEANATKTTLGRPTGLPSLDEITGGMIPGQLWAIGAPTSAGKTTLLCQLVAEAIKATGAACLFYSNEMSLPLMYARLVGAWQGINPTRIYRGRISDSEKATVEGTLQLCREAGLRVYREVMDADEIVRRTREARLSKAPDIVAVDFLQNVTAKADNMLQRMAEASRILQGLAGECNCCVLVASQLSNEGVREKGGGIFSYRYASELAHAADIGIEMVVESTGVSINVRKNRHGRIGVVKATFNSCWSAFVETDPRPERFSRALPGYD